MTAATNDYDVAVVGGGPAGSASAYFAAGLGLKTILFEKQVFPRDKPCGGAISARNIPLLGENALKIINGDIEEARIFGPSFQFFSYHQIHGYYVIRREFDAAMAQDARAAGAMVMENCLVKAINPLSSRDIEIKTEKGSFRATYVILATGFQNNHLIKQLAIRQKYEEDYLAITVVSETAVKNHVLEKSGIHGKSLSVFFGVVPNGYGWLFIKDGYLNIGIGATAVLLKDIGAINVYHRFVRVLKEKKLIPPYLALAKERPYPLPYKQTARETVFGNILLVGDAAGFVSPVSGEGIYYSIKSGQLAAQAIKENQEKGRPLSTYQKHWLKNFGRDINRYGYFLQKLIYKSSRRMEWAVKLARHDRKMAKIFISMLYGLYSYKRVIVNACCRLPVSLILSLFKRGI